MNISVRIKAAAVRKMDADGCWCVSLGNDWFGNTLTERNKTIGHVFCLYF